MKILKRISPADQVVKILKSSVTTPAASKSIFPAASTSLIAASTYNKSNMQQAASHNKYIFSVTCPVCSLAGTITIPRPAYFCYKKEKSNFKLT